MATIRLCCGDERSPLAGYAAPVSSVRDRGFPLRPQIAVSSPLPPAAVRLVGAGLSDWTPPTSGRPAISALASRAIKDVQPPVLPVVYFADDRAYRNDSTFVAYALEHCRPERRIIPRDAGFAFLSHLLENMADEWGVKIAFQIQVGQRARPEVQESNCHRRTARRRLQRRIPEDGSCAVRIASGQPHAARRLHSAKRCR